MMVVKRRIYIYKNGQHACYPSVDMNMLLLNFFLVDTLFGIHRVVPMAVIFNLAAHDILKVFAQLGGDGSHHTRANIAMIHFGYCCNLGSGTCHEELVGQIHFCAINSSFHYLIPKLILSNFHDAATGD